MCPPWWRRLVTKINTAASTKTSGKSILNKSFGQRGANVLQIPLGGDGFKSRKITCFFCYFLRLRVQKAILKGIIFSMNIELGSYIPSLSLIWAPILCNTTLCPVYSNNARQPNINFLAIFSNFTNSENWKKSVANVLMINLDIVKH